MEPPACTAARHKYYVRRVFAGLTCDQGSSDFSLDPRETSAGWIRLQYDETVLRTLPAPRDNPCLSLSASLGLQMEDGIFCGTLNNPIGFGYLLSFGV